MGHESTPYIPLEQLKRRSFSSQDISPLTGTPSSPQEPPGYGDHIDMESHFKPNKSVPPQRNRRRPTSRDTLTLLGGVWQIIKTLILPFVAIGYLTFCYIVHQRVVPLKTYGLFKVTPDHLAAIKGGITSVSIIIVSIALWPLTDLLSDLKSEEFFRVLSGHEKGVPLSTLNQISSPSFGQVQTLKAMISRHCSRYWIASFIGSLMVLITSTLAPAALSIQSVLSDGEIMAFAVGAIPSQIIWNASDTLFPGSKAADYSDTAASILWAEMELGVQYAFTAVNSADPSFAAYIVPTPPDLSTSTSSRWLTDVIGLNPTFLEDWMTFFLVQAW
ncbi:hypothetical protein BV22DRAFT_74847 [Leucogyrophana mollusca]|uniref:Uncharacterized protein n=1 Tax=Leucogyrophana mollusca TaxID=85980 RepID=A0ACB8BXG5_9AGAM|nr:hypothetical protein BV22DRAFT_74847 [Leucogyrophana mollusca]